MIPDREEALRLARTGDRSQMTRGDMSLLIDALAADLEAAERRVSKLEGDLDVSIQTGKLLVEQREAAERERDAEAERALDLARLSEEHLRDLATAREALRRVIRRGQMGHGMACAWIADDALRSLGEKK